MRASDLVKLVRSLREIYPATVISPSDYVLGTLNIIDMKNVRVFSISDHDLDMKSLEDVVQEVLNVWSK